MQLRSIIFTKPGRAGGTAERRFFCRLIWRDSGVISLSEFVNVYARRRLDEISK